MHVSLTSPSISAFPSLRQGRLPHDSFRGLLSVHSRYGPHIRGMAKPPFTPEASAASLPPRLLQLLPAGAKVAGWDLHPLKDRALARRTLTFEISVRRRVRHPPQHPPQHRRCDPPGAAPAASRCACCADVCRRCTLQHGPMASLSVSRCPTNPIRSRSTQHTDRSPSIAATNGPVQAPTAARA